MGTKINITASGQCGSIGTGATCIVSLQHTDVRLHTTNHTTHQHLLMYTTTHHLNHCHMQHHHKHCHIKQHALTTTITCNTITTTVTYNNTPSQPLSHATPSQPLSHTTPSTPPPLISTSTIAVTHPLHPPPYSSTKTHRSRATSGSRYTDSDGVLIFFAMLIISVSLGTPSVTFFADTPAK